MKSVIQRLIIIDFNIICQKSLKVIRYDPHTMKTNIESLDRIGNLFECFENVYWNIL